MNQPVHKTDSQNRTFYVPFYPLNFNGKEKDHESGFHYYGARYYWSEVLTGWLSVDPMMDKYPSISPYEYCALNPVKIVDPNGEKWKESSDSEQAENIKNDVMQRIKIIEADIQKCQKKIDRNILKGKCVEKQQKQLSELLNQKTLLQDFSQGLNELEQSDVIYTFNPTRGQYHEVSTFASPDIIYSINYQEGNTANLVHETTHAIQAERMYNGIYGRMTGMAMEQGAYSTQFSFSPQSFSNIMSDCSNTPSSKISPDWIKGVYYYEGGKKIHPYKGL